MKAIELEFQRCAVHTSKARRSLAEPFVENFILNNNCSCNHNPYLHTTNIAPESHAVVSTYFTLCFFQIVKERCRTNTSKYFHQALDPMRNSLDASTKPLGIEPKSFLNPPTFDLPARALRWWRMTGSNRRPPACKAGALPAELIPRYPVVGQVGIEPTTPALSRRCSNRLSY